MANELTYQIQVLLRYAGVSDQFASGSKVVNQTNKYFIKAVQNIGFATHEALDMGAEINAGNIGYVLGVNLGVNNIDVGQDFVGVFYPAVRLKPGEFAYARWDASAIGLPYAKASVAATDLFYTVYAT
jgi:hypothetical protein